MTLLHVGQWPVYHLVDTPYMGHGSPRLWVFEETRDRPFRLYPREEEIGEYATLQEATKALASWDKPKGGK